MCVLLHLEFASEIKRGIIYISKYNTCSRTRHCLAVLRLFESFSLGDLYLLLPVILGSNSFCLSNAIVKLSGVLSGPNFLNYRLNTIT